MKSDGPRRRIFDDAIDVMMGPEILPVVEGAVQEIPIDRIVPFKDHPFHLYEGERLDDMVDSIRTHGVLTPVIVRKQGDKFEMLAGHNRTNAAKLAGLKTVPAIVKEGLSDEEAYVYVVETNMMQRSFTDFLPSEKAAILKTRYETMKCQGRRTDILREIAILQGMDPDKITCDLIGQNSGKGENTEAGTKGLSVQRIDNRNALGEEYGLSSKSVARLLRLNHLIPVFKRMVDDGSLPIYAAVDLSFIPENIQGWIYDASEEYKFRINMKSARLFREEGEDLTQERIIEIATELTEKPAVQESYQKVRLPKTVYKKYFSDMQEDKAQAIILEALEKYFKEK